MITISGISLVGVLITAMVGPIVVERRKSGRVAHASAEPAVIAKHAGDAVVLIQAEINDLQTRVGRLEALQMAGAHGQR